MRKLFHYLKRHTLLLIICFALLFGQAMCDLSLPSLMSEIVNVGIQQGGISESAPKAIGADAMKLITTFMTKEEKQRVDSSYVLIPSGSSQSAKYEGKYPAVKTEDIYILENGKEDDALGTAFGRAAMTLLYFMKESAPQSSQASSPDFKQGLAEVDGWDLPATGDTTVIETLMATINSLNKSVLTAQDMRAVFFLDRKLSLKDDDSRIKRRKYIYLVKIYKGE